MVIHRIMLSATLQNLASRAGILLNDVIKFSGLILIHLKIVGQVHQLPGNPSKILDL